MLASSMAAAENLHCLVEVPKGSRNKYVWDEGLAAIKLDRFLFSSVVYPTDYGFIPETLTAKGAALDAMVCVSAPTFPGCVIPVKVIAVFRTRDEKGQDDKLLCVPREDPNWNEMESLDDLADTLRTEIEHFWSIYKEPEGKPVEIHGWEDRDVALEVLEQGRERWRDEGAPAGPLPRASVAGVGVDRRDQVLAGREPAHVLLHALGEQRLLHRGRVRQVRRDQRRSSAPTAGGRPAAAPGR